MSASHMFSAPALNHLCLRSESAYMYITRIACRGNMFKFICLVCRDRESKSPEC